MGNWLHSTAAVDVRRTSWSWAEAPASALGRGGRDAAVPVLNYHAVGADVPGRHAPFAVTAEEFGRHLDAIADAGLRTITFGQYAEARARGSALEGSVVLTFDDGFVDFHHVAAPMLADRCMVATAFVPTGHVAPTARSTGWRQMSWCEIRDVMGAGMEIGSHGHRHVALDLDPRIAATELGSSRTILEQELQRRVDTIAYPFGWSAPWLLELGRELGYVAGCIVDHSLGHPTEHPLAVSRLRVRHDTTAELLSGWLAGHGVRPAGRGERLATRAYRLVRRTRRLLHGERVDPWP